MQPRIGVHHRLRDRRRAVQKIVGSREHLNVDKDVVSHLQLLLGDRDKVGNLSRDARLDGGHVHAVAPPPAPGLVRVARIHGALGGDVDDPVGEGFEKVDQIRLKDARVDLAAPTALVAAAHVHSQDGLPPRWVERAPSGVNLGSIRGVQPVHARDDGGSVQPPAAEDRFVEAPARARALALVELGRVDVVPLPHRPQREPTHLNAGVVERDSLRFGRANIGARLHPFAHIWAVRLEEGLPQTAGAIKGPCGAHCALHPGSLELDNQHLLLVPTVERSVDCHGVEEVAERCVLLGALVGEHGHVEVAWRTDAGVWTRRRPQGGLHHLSLSAPAVQLWVLQRDRAGSVRYARRAAGITAWLVAGHGRRDRLRRCVLHLLRVLICT
eukprot:3588837-Prymnesium_polylepis.1